MEAERAAALVGGAVATAHPAPRSPAARYLAISSKKSMWALKKNDRRGANSSTARPRILGELHEAKPLASVKASSWSAVEPASRMWSAGNRDGVPAGHLDRAERDRVPHQPHRLAGGNTNSFWAWYSFKMSFWSVPPSSARAHRALRRWPRTSPAVPPPAVDGHRRGDRAEVDAAVEVGHVVDRVDGHAAAPDFAERLRVVGVEAHERGHVERGRQAVATGADRSLKRSFVSTAVPKPANIRIVHGLVRYIYMYGPRGHGGRPGKSPSSGP